MFKGTLEVGKEYELNNGEVYQCECMHSGNPWLNGTAYLPNGHAVGCSFDGPFSVRGPAVGTLAELGVKPEDVVTLAYSKGHKQHTVVSISPPLIVLSEYGVCRDYDEQFRIISRAAHTAKPDAPTVFGNMTSTEKLALLLAEKNGKDIMMHSQGSIWEYKNPKCAFLNNKAYHVKSYPVVEIVSYKLAFDVIDGELTNPRFEPINEVKLPAQEDE